MREERTAQAMRNHYTKFLTPIIVRPKLVAPMPLDLTPPEFDADGNQLSRLDKFYAGNTQRVAREREETNEQKH